MAIGNRKAFQINPPQLTVLNPCIALLTCPSTDFLVVVVQVVSGQVVGVRRPRRLVLVVLDVHVGISVSTFFAFF
jgi:hypothetical protein